MKLKPIKNKTALKKALKRIDDLWGARQNPDKDDEHEDTELGLLVEERKEQEEIEVDINSQ